MHSQGKNLLLPLNGQKKYSRISPTVYVAVWQGKLVSLSGKNAGRMIQGNRVLTLRQIGYGSGDGFGGWNCRHDWFPFFEGASKRAYTDERLQELNRPHIDLGDGRLYTDYEVSQMQRALEREIRKCKRWVTGASAGVDSAPTEAAEKAMKAELTDASVALKQAEQKLKDFCDQTGFLPDDTRVWVNGFGRSEAQRTVWENKKFMQKFLTTPSKSGKIETEAQAAIKAAFTFNSTTKPEDVARAIIDNHKALAEFTPESMKSMLEELGFETKPLGKSKKWKNVPFEQGGGYRIDFLGNGYFQYHPAGGSHHKGAYWRISCSKLGDVRYDMLGEQIPD